MEQRESVHAVGVVEINRLENEADRLHQEVIRRLFDEEKDPIAIIKWKEIFDYLEATIDSIEDVSNVIQGVVAQARLRRPWSLPSSSRSSPSRSSSTTSTAFTTPPTRSRPSCRRACSRPGKAVIWAAFFNFVAVFSFGTAVAKTIGSGMIDIHVVTFAVIFAGLFGAIVWDLITWYYGLPTSSSHALIGGYAGAAIAKAGLGRDHPVGLDQDARLHRGVAGRSGCVAGLMLMVAIYWIFRAHDAGRVDHWFRKLQLVSAALFSLNHGANDAQKTMGIIAGVLATAGYIDKATS